MSRRLALPAAADAPAKDPLAAVVDVRREAIFAAADQLEAAKARTRKLMDEVRAMLRGRGG